MKKINIQPLLYLYIIICPILDCASFLFRNALNTSISPSTIIRPIIVIIACLYIFITDKKQRKTLFLAAGAYGIYAISHLYIFTIVKNNSSYSGIIHELQYLVNYTFMVLNLYVYIYSFAKCKDTDELSKHVLISVSIYIISIYVAILTGTSSHTYMLEEMGFKGWFESGNSLSAILILSMFILLNMFSKKTISKKVKIWTGIIIGLVGIFLISLIGTRVGLFGFILVLGVFGMAQIICNIIHKNKVKQTIEKYNLIEENDKILVAVSGGPDSLSLLNILHDLGYDLCVAHVNHGLRENAQIDEEFVEKFCKEKSIPCYIKKIKLKEEMELYKN